MKPQRNAIVMIMGYCSFNDQYLSVRVPASSRGSKPSEPRYFVVVVFDWPSFNGRPILLLSFFLLFEALLESIGFNDRKESKIVGSMSFYT